MAFSHDLAVRVANSLLIIGGFLKRLTPLPVSARFRTYFCSLFHRQRQQSVISHPQCIKHGIKRSPHRPRAGVVSILCRRL